ncbi:MAG: hypothetical protein KDA60_17310 [Planctomycetales bacterium]|nr:hypothetical protein [Planctomycetales bacterium]
MATAGTGPRTISPSWVVSPAFDLLFFANLWWLVLGLPWISSWDGAGSISFFQVYFLTTPHRWITLGLVAIDSDRREGRRGWFMTLAMIAAIAIVAVYWTTAAFTCLVLVDFVWNAWHFAAQHGGILRIYSRKSGHEHRNLELYTMRILVTYVLLRLGAWTTAWFTGTPWTLTLLTVMDVAVLLPAVWLVVRELSDRPWERPGKVIYLLSVLGLYTTLLACVHWHWTQWLLALTTCGAAFHSVEYLAIVSYYADRRRASGSANLFRKVAKQWVWVFGMYIVIFGCISLYAMGNKSLTNWVLGLNLWAAFLHYAYDGMIWKLRRPRTAQALDAATSTG